jgi:hypothetical protein
LRVVGWDPFFVIGFAAGSDGWTFGVRGWAGCDGLLGLSRPPTSGAFLLLWEVGSKPDAVEGVGDTDGAGEEEEVEEDAMDVS